MKLILIRHAKSSWEHAGLADHARPLNARGLRAAPQIGAWLAQQGHVPDKVLVSDAARTLETLDLMKPYWNTPQVEVVPALYHAAPETIRAQILRHDEAGSLAVIGHNPGLAELAHRLGHSAHPRFADFPTCACAVFETDATLERAALSAFVTPHDL